VKILTWSLALSLRQQGLWLHDWAMTDNQVRQCMCFFVVIQKQPSVFILVRSAIDFRYYLPFILISSLLATIVFDCIVHTKLCSNPDPDNCTVPLRVINIH
jgi:hypothetical protein